VLEDLEKEFHGRLRIVWRNLPLSMHKDAEAAAEAAMEAFKQKGNKGFWAMHDLLLANQAQPRGLERSALLSYADQVKLDVSKFGVAIDTSAHQAQIEADLKAASDASITGTPTFVINGYLLSGAMPIVKFRKTIKLALSEVK